MKYKSFGEEGEVHPTKTTTRHINAPTENANGISLPIEANMLFA